MRRRFLPVIALLAFAIASPHEAFAAKEDGPKAKLMAKYDLNKNGKLDPDEVAAIRKDFAANPTGELARFDKDHDGKLSDEEIASMVPGSGKKSGGKKSSKSGSSASKDTAAAGATDSSATANAPAAATPASTATPPAATDDKTADPASPKP